MFEVAEKEHLHTWIKITNQTKQQERVPAEMIQSRPEC